MAKHFFFVNLAEMKYLRLLFIALGISTIAPFSLNAQMNANGASTAQQAVQLILGEGVEAFNVTSTGAANQVGTFTCNNCGIGFASGMILATGNVAVANGPNNSGAATLGGGNFGVSDPDLAMLVTSSLHDAATVTFQFVAQSDSVSFNYVFASEEYPEFANSAFNDVFGFFLSGPGISGPFSNNAINIALIPGTTLPVSINNVNATNNSQYYIPNPNTPLSTQFDAWTVPFMAFYDQLICGETYTIKLAIADALDTSWDSAVFIEANSFNLPVIDVALEMGDIGFDENTLLEGCGTANIIFTRNSNLGDSFDLELTIGGTATNGVDYTEIPEIVTFEPGQSQIIIPLTAFLDDLVEGTENIIITYVAMGNCSATMEQVLEIFIMDVAPLSVTIDDDLINCNETTTLVPEISGGYGVYSVSWEGFGAGASIEVTPSETTTYYFMVSDTCGMPPAEATVTVNVPVLPPVEAITSNPIGIDCLTELATSGSAAGGNNEYSFEWLDPNGNVISTQPAVQFEPSQPGALTLQVTDGCGETATAQQEFFFNEVPIEVTLQQNISALCLDQVTVTTAQLGGGIGNLSLVWTVNGNAGGTNASTSFVLTQPTEVQVTVSDQCGNVTSASTTIDVLPSPVTVSLPTNLSAPCVEEFEVAIATLNGGVGTFTYEWQLNGAAAGNNSTLVVNLNSQATVGVNVTDGCGNTASATAPVAITPVPISVDLGDDFVAACLEDVLVVADVTGGVPPMTYSWVLNALDQQTGADQLEFVAMGNMAVNVTVFDVCNNTATNQLNVTVPPNPPSVIVSNDTLVCKGNQANLWAEVVNPVGNMAFKWLPGNETTSSITVSPTQTTTYTVAVTDICNRTTLREVRVIVEEVTANFDFSYTSGWGIQTYNTSWPTDSDYIWDFGDGTTTTEVSPSHDFLDNSRQYVTLFAVSPNGCIDRETAMFDPIMDIFVPSAFTPNGDGVNDVFMARGHSIREFEMWIYNRWGELVFYSKDIDEPWLGEVKGGDHFGQNEVYTWKVKAVGIRNNSFERTGTVVLIR